jgi:hypothetical protein
MRGAAAFSACAAQELRGAHRPEEARSNAPLDVERRIEEHEALDEVRPLEQEIERDYRAPL